jgi:hypothetical protein
MQQLSMKSNSTINAPRENIMVAFQDKAQQITREHVEMLQMIYQKNHADVERRKMLFEQHYIFLKEELADTLNQFINNHRVNASHRTNRANDKLAETVDRYLNFFQDNCNPKRYSSGI